MDPLHLTPRSQPPHFEAPSYDKPYVSQNEEPHDSFIVELFKYAILALVIVLPFRLFIAQPFIVSGASMSPTFETGQYLIIDQLSYRFDSPHRGDVVVFKYPNDPSKYFIKRIIGLPGETVEVRGNQVIIKDTVAGTERVLTEPYLPKTSGGFGNVTERLDPDEYYVMGDNRDQSSDSRQWGPVRDRYIVGRALVRLLPPTLLGLLPGEYKFDDPANIK